MMDGEADKLAAKEITRRQFLQGTAGVIGGVSLFGLAACGGSTGGSKITPSGGPKRGGVITYSIGSLSPSDSLDPCHTFTADEDIYITAMYDLLTVMATDWNPQPRLATSWEPNDKLTKWTFHMRDGVKFHDGEPFTSRDAAWTLSRVLDPKVGAIYYAHWATILDKEGISTPDAKTLVLSLKKPSALPPILLGIRAHEIVREGTSDFSKKVNGTGPFKLLSMTPGQRWELQRNPDYWQAGLPYLEGIRGIASTDPAGRVQSVLQGDADLTDWIDYTLAKTVQGSTVAHLRRDIARIEPYIATDIRKKPFDDNRVRMAMKLACDRKLILATAYAGMGVLTSDVPVPSDDPVYPPNLGIREYNIQQAKQLLSEAGYPNGVDVELVTGQVIGGMIDMNVAFQQTVAPAGIRMKITQAPADTYFEKVWIQVPMFVQWILRRHPGVRFQMTMTSNAVWQETHYQNTPLDAMVNKIELDPTNPEVYYEPITWVSGNEGMYDPSFGDGLIVQKNRVKDLGIKIAADYIFERANIA